MRPPRLLEKNALYHTVARANLQEKIFNNDEDKAMVEEVVSLARKKFGFRQKHFTVMENHIHLLIQPIGNDYSLSAIMQWILSVIAIRYNKKYHRKGHVWYDRFKSKIVRGSAYFNAVIKYISNNPVKAKLAKDIFSYKFSGIYHLMNKKYHIVDEPDEAMLEIYPFLRD